jgi:hypothetical protein
MDMKLALKFSPIPESLWTELSCYMRTMCWYTDETGTFHRTTEFHIDDTVEYMRYSMLCAAYMVDSSWVRTDPTCLDEIL